MTTQYLEQYEDAVLRLEEPELFLDEEIDLDHAAETDIGPLHARA